MQDLEKKYFDNLRNECQRIILTNEMKIIEFLYKIIYNRDYFELTKYDEILENQLNQKICEQILYPFKSDAIITIQQAIILIPGYASFFMGSKIILHQIIHGDSAQFWDIFMNACAYRVNLNKDKHDIQIAKFKELLEIENKQYLALSLQQSEQLIDNFMKPNQLLKLLNVFFQDCFLFKIQNQYEKTSSYLQFIGEKKKQHFLNVMNFLIDHFYEEINGCYDYQKLKIAQSFVLNDYGQEYLYSQIDLYTRGMIIYSLIEYDSKQFTCILNFLSNQEKLQIIDRIIYSVKDYNSEYIKLILAAQCLKNVGDWEQSEKLFQLILYKQQQTTKKYGVYIYLSLSKLRLFQGDLKNSLKYNSNAISIIDQFTKLELDYYKPNMNKDLLIDALMREVLLAVYLNKKNIIETSLIRIKNIINQSDSHHYKRPVTQIFQRFMQLLSESKQPYDKNEKKAIQDFTTIQTKINQLLQQRVQYNLQQSTQLSFNIFYSIFQKNQYCNEQTYFPPKIYQLYSQLMIFNVLLYKFNMPTDIYYVDVRYYQILYKIIKNTNLYNDSIKSQLFFSLSHFEDSLEIAKRQNDHKLLGQIYQYQGDYEQALINYQKIFDTDCYFNIANILMINGKYTEAVQMLNRLKQLSPQYQLICAGYILKAQQNYQQPLYYSQRRNNLVGSISESDYPLRKAKTNEFIKIEQPKVQNVESILEQNDTQSENNSDSMIQNIEIPAFENEFQFQLRNDIQYFYQNIMNTCWSKSKENVQILKDFIIYTKYLEIESCQFFQEEKFQVGKRIGNESSQGKVNLVTYLGKEYASKITSFSFQATGENIRQENIDALKERLFEITIQSKITQLNYPYTPHLKHLGFYFKKVGEDKVIKIFTLTDYFQPSSNVYKFNIEQQINFCFKLAIILNMLQTDLKIIHQDLKPDNILVSEYDPVLIDYGISNSHIVSQKTQNFIVSTVRYQDQEYSRTLIKSKKNDVYSFGATIYNLITDEYPFPDKTYQQLIGHEFDFYQYHENTIMKIQNPFIRHIIKRCTSKFAERPYFSEVIYLFLENLFESQDLNSFLKLLNHNFKNCNLSLQNIKSIQVVLQNYSQYQLPKQFNYQIIKNIDKVLSHVIVNEEEMLVFNYKIQLNNQDNVEKIYQSIYQYVQMIANWILLNDNSNIAKLKYFSIKCEESVKEQQNEYKQIQFAIYLKSYELFSKQITNWKLFCIQMLNILKEVHQKQIILLNIPKFYLFFKDQQLILGDLSQSQNINNILQISSDNLDPQIKIQRKLSYENDVYALGILLQNLYEQNRQEIDEFLGDFGSINSDRLTVEQLIEKLNK